MAYKKISSEHFGFQSVLVIAMLGTMAWVESSASTIYILTLVFGLFALCKNWSFPSPVGSMAIICLVCFSAIFISIVNADDIYKFFARLERLLRMFFLPLAILTFLSMKSDPRRDFEVGILISSIVCLLALLKGHLGSPMAGAYNSILLGDFTAYLMCAGCAAFFMRPKGDLFKAALGVATMIFFLCSVEAGTRGAWLAILAILTVFSLWTVAQGIKRFRFSGAMAQNLLLIGFVLLTSISSERVLARLSLVQSDLIGFSSGSDVDTSIGLRFQMWNAAYVMWQENPWIGSGLGDYGLDLRSLMLKAPETISVHFGEAHSIYFEFLATTGLVGLGALLFSVFLYPAIIFAKGHFRNAPNPMNIQGLVLISSFGIFGLSQNWLGRSSISSVYFFLLAFFLANAIRKYSNKSQDRSPS